MSNRKTAFHKPSTFSAASIRAISAIILLSKLQCGNPIYVVLKELAFQKQNACQIPVRVKHAFRFRVSVNDRFYFLFFTPLCSRFFLKFSLLRMPLKVFDKSKQFISVTSASTAQNYANVGHQHSEKIAKSQIKTWQHWPHFLYICS